ncbi:hypothetical protein P7D15_18090 [Bacillus cereus]|uniref:Uncharacterized protein n=1 Tax=Bacillus thuringiensis TaxID=1428 RepID=A0A9X6VBY4_BACTU|nr:MULTISPECIES: hypothetical protein [Bacillus cereus group]MDF9599519.1 hypothetical protein [Bacillus cereus]MDG1592683.1 hypothetical protein [Bacillus cereus]MEC3270542.1 hypothetical protein [Bacillus thuringiensis]PFB07576.1 hypothetical protein CN398_12360 [Bacillus thuringiensis]
MNIKNKNKMLSLFATGVVLTAGLPLTAHADTEKKEIAVQEVQGEKVVPMKKLLDEMKGQVQEGSDENGDYKVYIVGNKSIKIHEKSSCAYVDGELQPYKKDKIGGYTFPTYWEPMYTADDVLVPANFVVDVLPVKLNGDKIEFDVEKKQEAPKEEPKTEVKEEKPSTAPISKGQEQTQKQPVIENKEESKVVQKREVNQGNQATKGNGQSNASQQQVVKPKEPTHPKNDDTNNKEVQVKEDKPVQPSQNNQDDNKAENKNVDEGKANTVDGKTYTAPEVKQLAYSLGFIEDEVGLKFNPYGKKGDDSYTISNIYTPGNGEWDVKLFIYNGNKLIDEPLKALFNKMLPTKGEELYSLVNTPNVKSQELVFDGRRIKISKTQVLSILLGPIEK